MAAQPLLLTCGVFAQAYGESNYGGGIYNNAHTETPSQPSSGGQTPSTGSGSPNDASLSETGEQSDATNANSNTDDKQTNDSDKTTQNNGQKTDKNDTSAAPQSQSRDDSDKQSSSLLKWASIGAIIAAIVLIIAVIVRKRRQD